MTYLQLVHAIAKNIGKTLSDDDADFLLWELTAFPLVAGFELCCQIASALHGPQQVQP